MMKYEEQEALYYGYKAESMEAAFNSDKVYNLSAIDVDRESEPIKVKYIGTKMGKTTRYYKEMKFMNFGESFRSYEQIAMREVPEMMAVIVQDGYVVEVPSYLVKIIK